MPSAGPGWEESEKGVCHLGRASQPDRGPRDLGLEGRGGAEPAAFTSGLSSKRPAVDHNEARALRRGPGKPPQRTSESPSCLDGLATEFLMEEEVGDFGRRELALFLLVQGRLDLSFPGAAEDPCPSF